MGICPFASAQNRIASKPVQTKTPVPSVQNMLSRICPPSVNCRPLTINGRGSYFSRLPWAEKV